MKTMTYMKAAVILAMGISMAPLAAEARGNLTFDQAVNKCTERAIAYGRTLHGRFEDEPPEYKVQTEYRACVYANSGQYPTAKVQYRDSVLTLLRDALK